MTCAVVIYTVRRFDATANFCDVISQSAFTALSVAIVPAGLCASFIRSSVQATVTAVTRANKCLEAENGRKSRNYLLLCRTFHCVRIQLLNRNIHYIFFSIFIEFSINITELYSVVMTVIITVYHQGNQIKSHNRDGEYNMPRADDGRPRGKKRLIRHGHRWRGNMEAL